MPRKKTVTRAPLTFDLSEDLLTKIDHYREVSGARSKSEVIREALEHYDFADYRNQEKVHRQISVRIDPIQKKELFRLAKQKKTSIGELLRAAVKSLPQSVTIVEDDGEEF
ncbi:MAG: ribbon-helix-helix protein, CopG family [Opitutales bacterium]